MCVLYCWRVVWCELVRVGVFCGVLCVFVSVCACVVCVCVFCGVCVCVYVCVCECV